MKISVIMPTYNDAGSLSKTIDSLLKQTYENYELLIVDDGSTDDTKKVVNKYLSDKRISYTYQSNQDQLNAILNTLDKAKGDYIYILHSDDLLPSDDFFQKAISFMKENDIDGFMGDLIIIDKDDNIKGYQKVKKYNTKKHILPLQYLWLGRNLFIDVGFYKKSKYLDIVKNNYLIWNTPHYIDFRSNELSNLLVAPFPILKYRVFEDNYINSEIGTLNVLNGELRTLTNLMKSYCLPLYKAQYIKYRILNKLKLEWLYRPLYLHKEEVNKGEIIKFVIEKRIKNYKENIFLNSLINFYKKYQDKEIVINAKIDTGYYGKDMRAFNKRLLNNNLEDVYIELFAHMNSGFNSIVVKSESEKEKMEVICKFLCIYPFVKIKVRR